MPSTLPGVPAPDAKEKTPAERTAELLRKIALEYLCEEGLPPAKEMRRRLKNLAQKIDASFEETLAIFEDILPEFIGRGLGYTGVSITFRGEKPVD